VVDENEAQVSEALSAEGKAWLYKQTGTNGSFATSFESAEALRVLAKQVGYAVAWSGPRR
jgi:hypothetical protein